MWWPENQQEPHRRLGPCPGCGCTILADQWERTGTTWQPVGPRWTPVRQAPHDCVVALLQNAAHWHYTVVMSRVRRPRGWGERHPPGGATLRSVPHTTKETSQGS